MEEHAFCVRSLYNSAKCEQLFSKILRRKAVMKGLDVKGLLDSEEDLGIMHSDKGNHEGEKLLREVVELGGRLYQIGFRPKGY
jgi:hypothetical protein